MELSDKELLELAAKAAGYEAYGVSGLPSQKGGLVLYGAHDKYSWNPLEDDGDALRLAVKLELICEYRRWANEAFVIHHALGRWWAERRNGTDEDATCRAMRRAITLAAAGIARPDAQQP